MEEVPNIRIMGEGNEFEICSIALDPEDVPWGKDVAQIKALICSNPEVQQLFPNLLYHGIALRDGTGALLDDRTFVAGGQTVHLASTKGMTVEKTERLPGTLVYWKERPYLVPHGAKLATYVCDQLGLQPADRYYVSKSFDYYVLKCSDDSGAKKVEPIVSVKNDNNIVAVTAPAPAPAAVDVWSLDDDLVSLLMPNGGTQWYTVEPEVKGLRSEPARFVLAKICAQQQWNPADYTMTHFGSELTVFHVFPGDKYQIKPLPMLPKK